MQIEQLVRELGRREHVALDPASSANEKRLERRLETNEGSRDGESRVQVSPCTPARDEDSHQAGAASGSVAAAPWTRSFTLPMFTRIPVMKSDSTRFDRP